MAGALFGDDASILTNDDALGVSVDFDRTAYGAGVDRISVVVEAHEASPRDESVRLVEPVEPAAIGQKRLTLLLEDFPDRFINAFPMQPSVRGLRKFACDALSHNRAGATLQNADQRQPLARRLARVLRQKPIEISAPIFELRRQLNLAIVGKRRLLRAKDLANRVPRNPQVPGDLLDRLALEEMLPPDPADRLHNDNPNHPLSTRAGRLPELRLRGSILHAETQRGP